MDAWWHSLSVDQQIFAGIALVGTVALVLQSLLMLAGIGHADLSVGDADAGSAGDHASGLSFLSVRSLIAFTTGFGWTGFALSHAGTGVTTAILGALFIGALLMWSVVTIMRSMTRLTYSGTLDYRNAIGQSATVYASIPPALGAAGQVEVMIQGRLATIPAMTKAEQLLAPRTRVRVVELVDRSTLLVEPLA